MEIVVEILLVGLIHIAEAIAPQEAILLVLVEVLLVVAQEVIAGRPAEVDALGDNRR